MLMQNTSPATRSVTCAVSALRRQTSITSRVSPSQDQGTTRSNGDGTGTKCRSPPLLTLTRRIASNGDRGPESTAIFPLPALRPPTDGLIALLDAPAVAQLHQPALMTLVVRNNHPTRAANVHVALEPDPAEAFVVAGVPPCW